VVRVGAGAVGIPTENLWLEAVALRPDLVARHLDIQVERAARQIPFLAQQGFRYIWGGGDFAGNGGPMYSPLVLQELVLPRLRRITAICHQAGMQYLFASDGDLWSVADDLFGRSGVDGYYEIDLLAEMDLRRLRETIDPPAAQQAATAAANQRAALDQAITRDPNNPSLLMQRAQAAWAAGDVQRTILDLNEVIRLQPRNGEAFRIRGLAHARRGDAVRTINDLTQAINLNVRDANTYLFRAEAHVRRNARQQAIADYRQVLRIEPGNRFALNGLRRYGLNN
jgi:tetratricopeptide (TPR) repeat protein